MLLLCTERVARIRTIASCLAAGAVVVFAPAGAEAHFRLNTPASWMSQDTNGGPQKNGPCAATPNTGLGDVAGTPTNMVTVVQPGQMVSVSVTATIAHPGWYRVSLRKGASSTQMIQMFPDPPQTVAQCTPAIMTNPVWSPTQPVLADGLGLPAGSTSSTTVQSGTKTFQVTIPQSANCTSAQPCALQVIMVMTDHPANDCYYHHCADIAVGAGGASDAGVTMSDAASQPPRDAGGTSTGTGGSTGSAGSGGSTGTGTGGSTGSGGASGAGTGGNEATGGSSGSAGSAEVGGSNGGSSTGGSAGSAAGGISAGTGGAASESDAGGVVEPAADMSSGGCAVALGSKSGAAWAAGLVALMALGATRRRRR